MFFSASPTYLLSRSEYRFTRSFFFSVFEQGEATHYAMTMHTTTLALRFDPSVNGQWLVTIEKNRWGRHGFSMRVALYAGRWSEAA